MARQSRKGQSAGAPRIERSSRGRRLAVGTLEAKTRLSELLQRAERGEEILIMRRGQPVAKLVPASPVAAAAAERWRRAIARLGRIQMRLAPGETIKQFIEAGRRF